MTIDVARARAETPGCGNVLHFNNAGAALMPDPVLAAVKDHLDLEASVGGYEAAAQRAAALDGVYDGIARLINCRRHEVALVENATRAWDMAFYGMARHLGPGDRILTAQAEYASNVIAFLQVAKRRGVIIETIPDERGGQVSIAALEGMIDERVKLIAITHVPTNGGLVNPAAAIGRVANAAGVPYLLDACQSVGQMPIDVADIGCDMLSATGRKYLRAPRGTGFLYVRDAIVDKLDPPFLDLHAATWTATESFEIQPGARRFETWESNIAGRIGLGVAVDYALGWGLDEIGRRVRALAAALRERLADIPGVALHDLGSKLCGIVSFTVAGRDPTDVQARLAAQGINSSVSPLVYTRYDMENRGLTAGLNRASVHYYNDEDEVERFAAAVAALAAD